jgi:hypothetical protein
VHLGGSLRARDGAVASNIPAALAAIAAPFALLIVIALAYIGMAGTTLPPFALHSFSVISIQPLPLHEFLPAHELLLLLQAPLPLHEFTPSQWTLAAESAAEETAGAPARNRPAAAAAMNAPLLVKFRSPLLGRGFA